MKPGWGVRWCLPGRSADTEMSATLSRAFTLKQGRFGYEFHKLDRI